MSDYLFPRLINNSISSIFMECVKIYANHFGLVPFPEYVDENNTILKRLNKFELYKHIINWHIDYISEHEFAEAGFIPHGFDGVQCITCGLVLRSWKFTDNPWIEHEKWGLNCAYVALNTEHINIRKSYYTINAIEYVKDMWKLNCVQKLVKNGNLHKIVKALLFYYKEDKDKEYINFEKIESYCEKDLQYKLVDKIEDFKECKVCYNEEKNIIFIPCGHIIVGSLCALSFDKCCLCRKEIRAYKKVYFA